MNATAESVWCYLKIIVVVVADEVEEARESSSHRGKLVGSQSARLSSHRARVVSANRSRDHLETW